MDLMSISFSRAGIGILFRAQYCFKQAEKRAGPYVDLVG